MRAVVPDDPQARPAAQWADRAFHAVLNTGLAALGFFLLFSTAGTSISLFVLLMLCLLSPHRIWRLAPWRDPVMAIGLVLLAYIGLRGFIGEGISWGSVSAMNRYHELLMVPLLWAMMRMSRRLHLFMTGLITGALLFAALYWIGRLVPDLSQFLHMRRISAGFGFAVCAYLLLERARLGEGRRLPNLVGAAFLVLTVLFVIDSRTGYVVLLVLLGAAVYRWSPRRLRLPAVIALLVATVGVASLSSPVRQRLASTLQETQASFAGDTRTTSTGARIQLFRNGVVIARQNWALGTGWQTYSQAFDELSNARQVNMLELIGAPTSNNPHNEYLMQMGAGGLPALLLFLLWLAWPMARALRQPAEANPWTGTAGVLALAFATGCLFNSLLLDYVEGHLYGALLSWLLVRRQEA